jgi:sRNA-binding protein
MSSEVRLYYTNWRYVSTTERTGMADPHINGDTAFVLASDHTAALADQLQAHQRAEQMLKDEIEGLRKDAARYRWLEAHANKCTGSEWAEYSFRIPDGCDLRYSLKEMIDAALTPKEPT